MEISEAIASGALTPPEVAGAASLAPPAHARMAIARLLAMSALTFGFYELVWFYLQWRQVAKHERLKPWPSARALLSPLFAWTLFSRIRRSAPPESGGALRQSALLAGAWTMLFLAPFLFGQLSGRFATFVLLSSGALAVVPLIPVQRAINRLVAKSHPPARTAVGVLLGEAAAALVGAGVWVLVILTCVQLYREKQQHLTPFEIAAASCDKGIAASCAEAGLLCRDGGDGIAKDQPRAVLFFQMACDGRVASGCNDLGVAYDQGTGIALNVGNASAMFEKACNLGDALGCVNLGRDYAAGRGVSLDATRAVALYERGCSGGSASGCFELGSSFHNGLGTTQDLPGAAKLFQRACDEGSSSGCFALALFYEQGTVFAKDLPAAIKLYEKACGQGHADACFNLGNIYQSGEEGLQDHSKAIALFEKSCDRGSNSACNNLGLSYVKGFGVEKDRGHAAKVFQRACENKDATACYNLGLVLQRGDGVGKDEARARELFVQACNGGESAACDTR